MSKRIKQGNVGPLWRVGVQSYDTNGLPIDGQYEDLSTNYTCKISVPSASTPIVARPVTRLSADNTRFLVQLAPVDTDLLAADTKHTVAIEVANDQLTPEFKIEVHVDLVVDEDLI